MILEPQLIAYQPLEVPMGKTELRTRLHAWHVQLRFPGRF